MHRNFKYLDDLIHSNTKNISLTYDTLLDDEEELNYIDGIKLDVDDVDLYIYISIFWLNNGFFNDLIKSRLLKICLKKDAVVKSDY